MEAICSMPTMSLRASVQSNFSHPIKISPSCTVFRTTHVFNARKGPAAGRVHLRQPKRYGSSRFCARAAKDETFDPFAPMDDESPMLDPLGSIDFGEVRGGGPDTFLTTAEAGIVDLAPLDMHEKFLARLTISSLNLLKVISKEEGVPLAELNSGKVVDWFVKDAMRRAQDPSSGILKW